MATNPTPGERPTIGSVVPLHGRRASASAGRGGRAARHGLDYTYAHYQPGMRPVQWTSTAPITLRVVDGGAPDGKQLVRDLCQQMHDLTGLTLDPGAPLPPGVDLDQLTDQTIAVAFMTLNELATFSHRHPTVLRGRSQGHCKTRINRRDGSYSSAFVAVLQQPPGVSAPTALRGLRHQMGHALGLGHARSAHQLMSASPALALSDFTAAEVWALQHLYRSRPTSPDQSQICTLI